MTTTEFNEKYKDYLEEGFYGLSIELPEVIEYLDKKFENELTKIEGFEYSQIKLKFGQARFYASNVDQEKVNEIEKGINLLLKNTK